MKIQSLSDAQTWSINSGVVDWFDDETAEKLVEYIYRNASCIDDENENTLIAAFIRSIGQDPATYNL